MIKSINKYRTLSFEEKTVFTTAISIILNNILALGKLILSIFLYDIFFLIAGIFNLFIAISKAQCYIGIKHPEKKSFEYHNRAVGIFLMLAGFEYGIYMTRLLFFDKSVMHYNMFLGIIIACVSFTELVVAIIGCFRAFNRGHYYRNIKLINLCSALTAMVLTEIAIMSFASDKDPRVINGLFGIVVSFIIELIAIYIFIAPKISLIDREHNRYQVINNEKFNEKNIEIKLTNSKFYSDYYFKATIKDNVIDGHIVRGKNPIGSWNIYILILVIILSEILIFPYAIGALIYYFKNSKLVTKLDEYMLKNGCQKIELSELEVVTNA